MDWPEFHLTTFLDWLDEAAGGLIRLAYLAAGVTAVAVYFGAGQLPAGVDNALNAGLPWALSFAVETHTYLTARRVRAAWQDRDKSALRVNIGVLAVLLAFSAWNQLGYLSGAWTPPHSGPLALPTWLAYTVRALIVPAAFMAAAFLAPLAPPITAQIEGEARATLADVFKIARKQRKQMLREAEAAGRDLTGALVELVADDETRRIISHAYNAIRAPGDTLATPQGASMAQSGLPAIDAPHHFEATASLPTALPGGQETAQATGDDTSIGASEPPAATTTADAAPPTPDAPPTGPGSPTVASKPRRRATPAAANVTPMRSPRAPRRDKRTAARANARSGRRGKAEQRIRAVLAQEPDITPEALAIRAGVSSSTVSKWLAVIEAERRVAAAEQTAAQWLAQ